MNRVYRRLALAARALRYGNLNQQHVKSDWTLSEQDLQEVKEFFPLDKFFIFGHARSGTTLLARLVRVHPEVHCNWQAHFFTRPPFLSSLISNPEVAEWLSRRSNRWNRGGDLSSIVMRVAADFILEREAARVGKSVVGDKSPNNLVNGEAVRNLAEIYPDAKLVYIVRDGRDAVVSHQIQKFIDLPDKLGAEDSAIRRSLINSPEKYSSGKRSIFSSVGIRTAAEEWVRNVEETHSLGKEIFGQNFLTLRFEDLVAEPVKSLDQVWEHLGVDVNRPGLKEDLIRELARNPDAEWQGEKQPPVAEVIRKGVSGSWQEIFTSRDIRIFKEIAGETLIRWGYEESLDW